MSNMGLVKMFFKLVLCVHCLLFVNCMSGELDWDIFKPGGSPSYREELLIRNISTFPNSRINVTVAKWKTLNLGRFSYTAGIINHTKLVIIYSNKSSDAPRIKSELKTFDLGTPLTDLEFFDIFHEEEQKVFIVLLVQNTKLLWYSLNDTSVQLTWTWPIITSINHFHIFKVVKTNYLVVSTPTCLDIYSFDVFSSTLWYFQSIPLKHQANSFCAIASRDHVYISFTQPNQIQIFKHESKSFKFLQSIESFNVSQVVCFHNLFQKFLAFNGANSSIYELEQSRLTQVELENGNLESVDFYLPVRVNFFRDETLLLVQKKLHHDTHFSFHVNLMAYKGKKFVQHVDVPCSIYGEEENGFTCLANFNLDEGLLGSSCIAIDRHLAFAVPHLRNFTILVYTQVELKQIESSVIKDKLEGFWALKKRLEEEIESQNKQIAEKPKIVKKRVAPWADISEIGSLSDEIESLKHTKLKGHFGTIIFNASVHINNTLWTNSMKTNQDYRKTFDNMARKPFSKRFTKAKTFKNTLTVEELILEKIDNVSAKEFLTVKEGVLTIDGNVTFARKVEAFSVKLTNSSEIDQWINMKNLSNGDLNNVTFRNLNALYFETLSLNTQALSKKSVAIPGNVTVRNINDRNFEHFLSKLCLKNMNCKIDNLTVLGSINVTDQLNIRHLNSLQFPNEFILSKSKQKSIIDGSKTFTNVTRGYKVTTSNVLHNVDLNKTVSLSGDQSIPGNFTFENLKVVNEIEGNVTQKTVQFVTVNISANIDLNRLEVDGNIIVKNTINHIEFNKFLNNFILRNETVSTITGIKSFARGFNVLNNLNITSNMINNISLNSIVTKNTKQDLHLDSFEKNVDFEQLRVEGLFDGQNVTEMNETMVKTNENRTVAAELIFHDNVTAEEVVALETANLTQSFIDTITVEGNLTGSIRNFSFEQLEVLQYRGHQVIQKPYIIDKLKCDKFNSSFINNMKDLFKYERLRYNLSAILTYRNASVNSMNVYHNLTLHQVNGDDFDKTLYTHPWIKLHTNSSNFTINGNAVFESLQIANLADVNFNNFVAKIVFKNVTHVTISNTVNFLHGLKVKNLIETSKLNNVTLKNVLRKNGNQTIKGPLTVIGKVTLQDGCLVQKAINGIELKYLVEHFDVENETLNLKGDLLFSRIPYIRNLTIKGLINGQNFSKASKKFVYLNDDVKLENSTFFNNSVEVEGNLVHQGTINDVKLSEIVKNILWLTYDDEVATPITFTRPVTCLKDLKINKEVATVLIHGTNLETVLNQSVSIERGLIGGTTRFENLKIYGNLQTQFVNDLNMSSVIHLKTAQTFKYLNITEATATKDFGVGNKVNGVVLEKVKSNTLMSNTDQVISSEIIFLNNIVVDHDLNVSIINKKPANKIVFTEIDQELTGDYTFKEKVVGENHLIVKGLLNNVNMTVKRAPTNAKHRHIKQKGLNNIKLLTSITSSNVSLNGISSTELFKNIQDHGSALEHYKKDLEAKMTDTCRNLTIMYEKLAASTNMFKYFEQAPYTLSLTANIKSVKHIQFNGEDYLLVNQEENCYSDLWRFSVEDDFQKVCSVLSGPVNQIEVVEGGSKAAILVIRSDAGCNMTLKTSVWVLEGFDESLKLIATLEKFDEVLGGPNQSFYGLSSHEVSEFRIDLSRAVSVYECAKWKVFTENATFLPWNIGWGLALRTNGKVVFLNQFGFDINTLENSVTTTEVILGEVEEKLNFVIPGKNDGSVASLNVGSERLLAVMQKQTPHINNEHIIQIYSDPMKKELLDLIHVNQPIAMIPIELSSKEALLAVLEADNRLEIYEYKGTRGFTHMSSIKASAKKMFVFYSQTDEANMLGLVYEKRVDFYKAVMTSGKVEEKMFADDYC